MLGINYILRKIKTPFIDKLKINWYDFKRIFIFDHLDQIKNQT